ncbi:PREDICTED: B2 bradykinin receptor-like [Cyprinodon variegatus]|uniref:B2 bradykinin receptor n=1 Tax=Cyprinodon variegatus TaxID=28743 RepID=A0A3Q2D6G5_CYPVA|nr:PREDICTED: B2 bradykinin receptor-like [Cyprinodon variegatus]
MTLQATSVPDFSTTAFYADQNQTNDTSCPEPEAWGWIVLHVPAYILTISVLGIIFNLFVLLVFCLHKKPCTVAEIYLSNLVAADLVLVSCLPFWAVNISNNYNWPFGRFMCKTVNVGIKINIYCSIYFLVLVGMDRYVALVHAMSHGRMRRPKYAKLGCLLTWGFGLVISIPELLFREVRYFTEYDIHACYLEYPKFTLQIVYEVMQSILIFIVPTAVLLFCTVRIIRALSQQSIERFNAERTEKKATILVLVVLLAFLVCWVPFHIVTIFSILVDTEVLEECSITSAVDICHQIFTYLGFFNSVLNPVLYVIVGKNFRKKVRELMKQWGVKRTMTSESTRSNLSSTLKTLV